DVRGPLRRRSLPRLRQAGGHEAGDRAPLSRPLGGDGRFSEKGEGPLPPTPPRVPEGLLPIASLASARPSPRAAASLPRLDRLRQPEALFQRREARPALLLPEQVPRHVGLGVPRSLRDALLHG